MKAMKIIVLFFLIISYTGLLAQTLEMDWGQASELPKNHYYQKIIGSDKDGFYTIQSQGILGVNDETLTLEYFSTTTNAKESSNQVITPTVNGKPTHYEEMYYLNGKIILFSSLNSSSRKILYVQYLNTDGTLKNKPKEIGGIPASNSALNGFNISLNDAKKIVLSYHNTFAQYNSEPFVFKTINSDLIEESNVSLELPLKDRSFEITQSEIGKSGDVYMLVKAEKAKDKKKESANTEYEVIMMIYNTKKKEFHPFNLTADKYVPSNAIFGLDKEGNIIIGGFIANKTVKVANEFLGAFYMKINPNILKVTVVDPKQSIKLFSKDLMAEFSQERNGETPDKYYNYVMKDLVVFENGGFAFIAEQQYKTSTTIIAPGTKEETKIDYYFYNDLIVCGVSKEGVLAWQIRIPKNQNSSDDKGYYHSIATFVDANKMKIIFNDNRSNLNNKVAEKTKEIKNNPALIPKGQAVLATLYSDGSYEKYAMFKDEDAKFVIVPRMIIQAGKRYITYAQDGKSVKFGSFAFE